MADVRHPTQTQAKPRGISSYVKGSSPTSTPQPTTSSVVCNIRSSLPSERLCRDTMGCPSKSIEVSTVSHGNSTDHGTIMVDEATRKTLSAIPLLKTKAGPRDKDIWVQRLKEEYQALIKYVENNKAAGNDWFRLESNKEGTRWFGKCWHIQDLLKYEFDIEFDIPVTYPTTSPEIALPELDGKTAKMYRGGKICLTEHFKPLWARNVPKFGIAHAMALGLGPWLAVEIPELIERGVVSYKEKTGES